MVGLVDHVFQRPLNSVETEVDITLSTKKGSESFPLEHCNKTNQNYM